jgi:hypothetical protein
LAQQPAVPLKDSFAEIAAAVKDITTWDRHRIHLTEHMVRTGNARNPGSFEVGAWWRRSDLLLQAERIFEVMARHEDAVRALDPSLALDPSGPVELTPSLDPSLPAR